MNMENDIEIYEEINNFEFTKEATIKLDSLYLIQASSSIIERRDHSGDFLPWDEVFNFASREGGALGPYIDRTKEIDARKLLTELLKLSVKVNGKNVFINKDFASAYIENFENTINVVRELGDKIDNNDVSDELENIETLSSMWEGQEPSSKCIDIFMEYGMVPNTRLYLTKNPLNNVYKDVLEETAAVEKNTIETNKKSLDITSETENLGKEEESEINNQDIENLRYPVRRDYSKRNRGSYSKEVKTSEDYENFLNNPFYIQSESKSKLGVQVLIFSKTRKRFFDVTNFITSVNTSVSKESGGNFDINFQLISETDLEKGVNSHFQYNNINKSGYVKALYLQSVFRSNDIVYIRFENLKDEVEPEKGKLIIGKNWDMIGLIDSTKIDSRFDAIDVSISGRDMIKLLIEDNNVFIPYQWANNSKNMFGGNGSGIYKRLYATGTFETEFVKSFKEIGNSVGWIISQLTNTQILSDDCLDILKREYGDKLTKSFSYSINGKNQEDLPIYGAWGLVNYIVDSSVSNYRTADASLKDPSGSILEQIYKICQKPFVELIADTYIDKYILYIRRPPFSMDDIIATRKIVIKPDVCISDSLEFSKEVYTVYHINPQGGCFARGENYAMNYIPWVTLDDYTLLWGMRLYDQNYNYMNIETFNKTPEPNKKDGKEGYIDDLLWLIETTAYLPFSRQGTITIKGDRRIKVGQWIFYSKSNEYFYVDGVSQSISIQGGNIDRKTILQVSRGLVKDYVRSPKNTASGYLSDQNISYGDLVDLALIREGLIETTIKNNKKYNKVRKEKDNIE